MAEIHRIRTIAASQGETWSVLADFGAIASWADSADHSCILTQGSEGQPVGTTRRVQMGRNTLVERITEFVAPQTIAYDIDGLPRRMGRIANRWTLRPEQDGSTLVTLTSTVEIGSGPMENLTERAFTHVMARQSTALLAALAKRLEP